jgi:hypothetical protein
MSKDIHLLIFEYLDVKSVYRYGFFSKSLYKLVRSIKFDEYVEIKLDPKMKYWYYLGDLYKNLHLFPKDVHPFTVLYRGDPEENIRKNGYYYSFPLKDKERGIIPDLFDIYLENLIKNKNVKFKIMIDEVNDLKMLQFVDELPSADNLFYYFEGDFAMMPDEDGMNKPLPTNILRIKPRQLMCERTTFNTIFSQTKFIDELIMDNWREMTDISCLKDIKINKLHLFGCYMIENLHVLKNCGIKDMIIHYPDIDWFWNQEIIEFLRSINKLEIWVMMVRRSRQGHYLTIGTLEDLIPNVDVGYR